MTRLGRAMADPRRSRILLLLLHGPNYPAQLARELNLSRTNVSNQLACLRGCGIVTTETQGRQTQYQIADPRLTRALETLADLVLAVEDGVTCTDEGCLVQLCCQIPEPTHAPELTQAQS